MLLRFTLHTDADTVETGDVLIDPDEVVMVVNDEMIDGDVPVAVIHIRGASMPIHVRDLKRTAQARIAAARGDIIGEEDE